MQQQNVINTTNAITTYCFKFHPPFLSPEVLSVCRLSLSIVNLLAVPLLSAAAIPSSARPKPLRSSGLAGVRPISFSYAYGKRSEKPTVFPDPLARSHASDPAAAKSSRSASPKSLRTFGLAGVRPIIRAICNIKPAGSLILPVGTAGTAHCLCVHYTPCREVFQSLFFICR